MRAFYCHGLLVTVRNSAAVAVNLSRHEHQFFVRSQETFVELATFYYARAAQGQPDLSVVIL